MSSDEKEIRDLVATWMKATREGDSKAVLDLMADDIVFMIPGQPPFGKEAFASAGRDMASLSLEIDGDSDILEITIAGDWAFMMSHLRVTIKSNGVLQMVRAGNTLSVLRKIDGRWQLYRDANLLVPVQDPGNAP